jgi:lipoate-protein ligase B
LVEHPPTLTLGRRGSREDVLWSNEQLAAMGVDVCDSPRGGQVTLHAPGQLVAYPIATIGTKIRAHITRLGEVALRLVAELGVEGGEFRIEQPGVWLGARKLASIGVHVSRGVTVQGIAINLDVDPMLFGALVSCGMPQAAMTSVVREGGRDVTVASAARRYAELWAQACEERLVWEGAAPPHDC